MNKYIKYVLFAEKAYAKNVNIAMTLFLFDIKLCL